MLKSSYIIIVCIEIPSEIIHTHKILKAVLNDVMCKEIDVLFEFVYYLFKKQG